MSNDKFGGRHVLLGVQSGQLVGDISSARSQDPSISAQASKIVRDQQRHIVLQPASPIRKSRASRRIGELPLVEAYEVKLRSLFDVFNWNNEERVRRKEVIVAKTLQADTWPPRAVNHSKEQHQLCEPEQDVFFWRDWLRAAQVRQTWDADIIGGIVAHAETPVTSGTAGSRADPGLTCLTAITRQ